MSLSDNIKKFRLKKDLTQEQLAKALGVSAQAVSKWENSDTYPDGALLVPLANQLDVSLDELFGNDSTSMADISKKIIRLLHVTRSKERFNVARDICWQIERGLFYCHTVLDEEYDPNDIKGRKNASCIINNRGFTLVSNGKEPFFSVFPQPEEGYGHFLNNKEELRSIFEALADNDTLNAVIYLYRKTANYIFEAPVLAKACDISAEKISKVISDLSTLKVIYEKRLEVNGKERTLYCSTPNVKLLALFLVAQEMGYKGAYCLQNENRSDPLLK